MTHSNHSSATARRSSAFGFTSLLALLWLAVGCGPSNDIPDVELPACSDGIDNDDDVLVDFPDDPECSCHPWQHKSIVTIRQNSPEWATQHHHRRLEAEARADACRTQELCWRVPCPADRNSNSGTS